MLRNQIEQETSKGSRPVKELLLVSLSRYLYADDLFEKSLLTSICS